MKVMVYFLVFAGGVLNSLQSGSNSQLKKLLGKPWISGVVLYGNALAAFLWVATFLYDPLPTIQDFKNTPWCAYLGGAMGGVAVYAMLTPTDQIGAGPLNAILVTATIVTALLIDHYGFMGVKQHGPNIWRGLGCDRSYGIHRKVLKQNSSTVVLLFTLKTLLVRIDLSRVSRVPTFAKDLRCCFACYRIPRVKLAGFVRSADLNMATDETPEHTGCCRRTFLLASSYSSAAVLTNVYLR